MSGPASDALGACLDDAERRRVDTLKFDRDKHRFIHAHAATRRLLGGVCGIAPEKLSLQVDRHGKPMLSPDCGVFFNLSHSDDEALLAVSRVAAVGVDLERARPLLDADALAARHFSERECAYLTSVTAGRSRDRAFFHCWTRKEAFIKCTGVGLRTDLRRIEAGFHGDAVVDGVFIRSLPDVDDFAAAFATEGTVATVEILDYHEA